MTFLGQGNNFYSSLVCESVFHTPYEASPGTLAGQPQGPLWTSSPECDYETIVFPHRLIVTHFSHPGNAFASSLA